MMACHARPASRPTKHDGCFTPASFVIVKQYILRRISLSSSGYRYLVEYPPAKTGPNDGSMRPSSHPEHVFDVRYDEGLDRIVFENARHSLWFHPAEGLVGRGTRTEAETQLATDLFCCILESSRQ